MSATDLPRIGTAEVDRHDATTDQYSVHRVSGDELLVQYVGYRRTDEARRTMSLAWWANGDPLTWHHWHTFTRVEIDGEQPRERPPLPETGPIEVVRADHCRWCERVALDPDYRRDSAGRDLGIGEGYRSGVRFAAGHPYGYPYPISNCRGDAYADGFYQGVVARWCPEHPYDPPHDHCLSGAACTAIVFALGARDAVPSWAGREDDAFVVQRITEARAAIREGREFWATYRAAHPT